MQYRILKRFFPLREEEAPPANAGLGLGKLHHLFGRELVESLRGKTVIDFGCGEGHEAIGLAKIGAKRVIGIDLREEILEIARDNAARAGVRDVCQFTTSPESKADVVVSIDAFEHFSDPLGILTIMERLLVPGGDVIVSFGPTWYHPVGGHLFSVFPWAHLLFTERALLQWRADYKSDGARRFSEVGGGLNQMTVRRFEEIVRRSPFRFADFEAVPIARLRHLHNRMTREFTTAVVRCRLVRRADAGATVNYGSHEAQPTRSSAAAG